MRRQPSDSAYLKKNQVESFTQSDNFEKSDNFAYRQKKSIKNWLLPCSLRSHRTANTPPKMGLASFMLPPHHPIFFWQSGTTCKKNIVSLQDVL
jgi:hypothetical protein